MRPRKTEGKGLQGRVKSPIGGTVRKRVRAGAGEIPAPTVTVWIEEDEPCSARRLGGVAVRLSL